MKRHKLPSERSIERPGNRPFGIPGNARFAGGAVFSGIILLAINALGNVEVYYNNPALYFRYGKVMFFPLLALAMGIAFMINSGRLILLKAFRILAVFVVIAYGLELTLDVYQLWIYPQDRAFGNFASGGMLVLTIPLLFLMRRDFRRSRWLDPASLPHEWEIAAVHDPNSINYRPPKPPHR